MNEKTEHLAQKQRARLLESAKSCFIEHGLSRTTMRNIADSANMSLGNIYRYFQNKEALIAAFIADDSQELDEAFALLDGAKNVKKELQGIGAAIIDEMANKAEIMLYTDILSEALRDEKIQAIVNLNSGEQSLKNCLKKAQKEQRVDLHLTADVTALAIIAFIENAAIKCITNDSYSKRTASRQFKQFVDTLMN